MSTQTQRGGPPPQLPKRSDRARRKLTFQLEHFTDIHREVLKLWKMHYDEIALDKDICPLDPDWEFYFAIDGDNPAVKLNLCILTARSSNGSLAGYIFNLIGNHNHYASTRFATSEMFWLHPYFRKGWQPVKMFLENLKALKQRQVKIATINLKLHFQDARVSKLLYRLGYRSTDIVMRKVLD